MISAPIPENDDDRVASLEAMNILSTAREADFDRVVRITQRYFKSEIALISLVDKDRQWFKANCGLDVQETGRDVSFCSHAIQHDDVFVVENTEADDRFFDNSLVTGGPKIKFYAGQPLQNRDNYKIGTLCVLASQPRKFSDEDKSMLQDLARIVEVLLENRTLGEAQKALLDSVASADRNALIDPLSGLWNQRGLDELFRRETYRAVRVQQPLAVGIIGVDHPPKSDGALDSNEGQEAIRFTAESLVHNARATDIIARVHGEQFVLIAPDVTPYTASTLGEKFLNGFRMRAKSMNAQKGDALTISIGIVVTQPVRYSNNLLESLLETGGKALSKAKEDGGDRFEISGAPENIAPAY